jgi:methylglutaconyl-CoA hydratase
MPAMPLVKVHRRGAVTVLELAHPETGNALSVGMVAELTAAVTAAQEGDARALVLAGSGRHFCTGADLRELSAGAGASLEERVVEADRLATLYAALLRCPILTLAAVQGAAYGGGAGLAAACDLVVASPEARFQFSEVRLGFVPALVATFLPRRVPHATLARLVLDPHPLDAQAALAVGLVDRVTDDPHASTEAWALEVCGKASPTALAETKRLLLSFALPRLDQELAEAAKANAQQRSHPECQRGIAEFLERKTFADWLQKG